MLVDTTKINKVSPKSSSKTITTTGWWFQPVSTCFNLFQPVSTCFNPPGPNTSKYVGQWGSPMIIIPGWMENKMPSQGTEGDMATDHPMRHRRKPG
jgi:hypothetical protein